MRNPPRPRGTDWCDRKLGELLRRESRECSDLSGAVPGSLVGSLSRVIRNQLNGDIVMSRMMRPGNAS